jgi:hypothetical protein
MEHRIFIRPTRIAWVDDLGVLCASFHVESGIVRVRRCINMRSPDYAYNAHQFAIFVARMRVCLLVEWGLLTRPGALHNPEVATMWELLEAEDELAAARDACELAVLAALFR